MPPVYINHEEKRILKYWTAEAKCAYIVQPTTTKYLLHMNTLLCIYSGLHKVEKYLKMNQ